MEEMAQHTVFAGLESVRILLWIQIRMTYNIFTLRKIKSVVI